MTLSKSKRSHHLACVCVCSPFVLQLILVLPLDWRSDRLLSSAQLSPCAPGSVGKGLKLEFGGGKG